MPLAVGVKAYLINFLFRRELEVVLVWIVWKNQFPPPQISWSLKLWFDEWPLERIFINEFTFCLKKQHVSDCQKEISVVQIMHLKLTFLTPDNIKSYYSQSIAR